MKTITRARRTAAVAMAMAVGIAGPSAIMADTAVAKTKVKAMPRHCIKYKKVKSKGKMVRRCAKYSK